MFVQHLKAHFILTCLQIPMKFVGFLWAFECTSLNLRKPPFRRNDNITFVFKKCITWEASLEKSQWLLPVVKSRCAFSDLYDTLMKPVQVSAQTSGESMT